MKEHKNELAAMSGRQLVARRRMRAGRVGDVELVLAGSLVEQARRCGKTGCRCADGEPHGPYAYFAQRAGGPGRLRYVPSSLVDTVRGDLRRGGEGGGGAAGGFRAQTPRVGPRGGGEGLDAAPPRGPPPGGGGGGLGRTNAGGG